MIIRISQLSFLFEQNTQYGNVQNIYPDFGMPINSISTRDRLLVISYMLYSTTNTSTTLQLIMYHLFSLNTSPTENLSNNCFTNAHITSFGQPISFLHDPLPSSKLCEMTTSWFCIYEMHNTLAIHGYSNQICDKHQVQSGTVHTN